MRRFSLKPRGNEGYLAWVLLLTVIVFRCSAIGF
jgi:hypothetical protein